jgi:dTDP-glucose 4,6-dehydratase
VRDHDVVVHLAARVNVDESIGSARSCLDVNVMGTWNVLEAVRRSGSRLIYGSSCEVYGSAQPLPVGERYELRPHSPYAASKAAADRLCFAYHTTHGVDVTIVRPCNIYGERQKSGGGGAVIPIFVEQALAGSPLTIFGDGSQQREYMNIDDVVRAYDLVLNRSDLAGETINFGSGETISVKQIAEFVVAQLGGSVEHGSARSGELPSILLDSAIARELGFESSVSFWDGLTRFIHWRRNAAAAC